MTPGEVDHVRHLLGKFVIEHPSLKENINKALIVRVLEERDALFFIPMQARRLEGTASIYEVHVHTLSTGKLVDVGSTTTDVLNIEHDLNRMIDGYVIDACHACIEDAQLCDKHLPPNGLKWAEYTCDACGEQDDEGFWSTEMHLFVGMCETMPPSSCCGNGPIYRCNDCGHKVHDPSF